MPLISEVVEAMTAAQEAGHKVLAFVIPVTEEALYNSGLSASTIEDRVQQALIGELQACLGGAYDEPTYTDKPDGDPVWLTDGEIEDLIYCVKAKLPPGTYQGMLSSSERRRRAILERLLNEVESRSGI